MREVPADSLSLDSPSSAGMQSDDRPGFIPPGTRVPPPTFRFSLSCLPGLKQEFPRYFPIF